MNDSSGSIIPFILIVTFIVFYFPQDWLEYECLEYGGDSEWTTGTTVKLYEEGGLILDYGDDERDKWKARYDIVEGTKYISYVRQDSNTWTYKLNKEDLTYYYRLRDRGGQCKEVGFFSKLMKASYDGFEW